MQPNTVLLFPQAKARNFIHSLYLKEASTAHGSL